MGLGYASCVEKWKSLPERLGIHKARRGLSLSDFRISSRKIVNEDGIDRKKARRQLMG
jgi:hypothetical protein